MTDDVLCRLAAADPARELDPVPPERLLAHTLSLPRPAAQRNRSGPRRRIRRVSAAAALAATALAAVSLVADRSGAPTLDLAARAYAQTAAESDQIIHTVVRVVRTETGPRGQSRETGTIEEWRRESETHRLETWLAETGRRTALDHVISSDGVMHQVTDDGGYRIVRASDNADAANVIAQEQAGFVAEFRRRYERGELDESDDVRFAGRPARRYVVSSSGQAALPPHGQQAYYLDRETGAPLGFASTLRMHIADGTQTPEATEIEVVQTVETIERLEPSADNLKRLRTHTLPRRRNADGCVRGPVTEARPSDTAARSDCGGEPGAPVWP